MTKEQEIQLMGLIIAEGGIVGGSAIFYSRHQSEFHFSQSECFAKFSEFSQKGYLKGLVITPKLQDALVLLKIELGKEESTTKLDKEQKATSLKLAKWQIKAFWPMLIISIFAGVSSIYNIVKKDDNIKKSELKKYVTKEQLNKIFQSKKSQY